MKEDLVSIIMPAYNASAFIAESIESVINQKYKNWELIVIDDASCDNTCDIIEKCIKKERRIKIIKNSTNQGVVKSRNIGLKQAKGRYIAFLDSDDLWYKNKLYRQIEFMKKRNYVFTFTGYKYLSENNKNTKEVKVIEKQDYYSGLKNTIIGCLTVVIDRSVTGEFYMPDIKHGEDHFTWLFLMKKGFNAYGLDECLAEYRITPNSLSRNKFRALKYQWDNYRNVAKLPILKCLYYYTAYVLNAFFKRI